MKYKYILAHFAIGVAAWFFAMTGKISFPSFAQTAVHISHIILILSCIFLALKLLGSKIGN